MGSLEIDKNPSCLGIDTLVHFSFLSNFKAHCAGVFRSIYSAMILWLCEIQIGEGFHLIKVSSRWLSFEKYPHFPANLSDLFPLSSHNHITANITTAIIVTHPISIPFPLLHPHYRLLLCVCNTKPCLRS